MASIHETALKTAARISFTLGALGCVEDANDIDPVAPDATPTDEADALWFEVDLGVFEVPDGALPDALVVVPPDSGARADGDFLADAWTDDASTDAAPDADIDAEPDMAPDAQAFPCEHLQDPADWEERAKCCEEIGWDPRVDPSCTPWGPPVPPAMPGSAR